MPKFKSTLSLGFTLINGGVEYYMAEGTQVEVVVAGPYEDETISGVIAGCSIKAIKSPNRVGRIYDGIPTHRFHTDDKANIKNAVDTFEVDQLLINTAAEGEDPVYREVFVSSIKKISGSFVAPDGSTTITVDPAETPVSEVLAEIPKDSEVATALVLADAEISEDLSLEVSVSIAGANVGVAQNFAQEV